MKIHYVSFVILLANSVFLGAMQRAKPQAQEALAIPGDETESLQVIIDLLLQDLIDAKEGPEAQAKKAQIKQLIQKLFTVIEMAHEKCLQQEELLRKKNDGNDAVARFRVAYDEAKKKEMGEPEPDRPSRTKDMAIGYVVGRTIEETIRWLRSSEPPSSVGAATGATTYAIRDFKL